MDLNDLRSLVTLLSFVLFSGILVWAYLPSRRAEFDAAANLPFADEGSGPSPQGRPKGEIPLGGTARSAKGAA